ncbi:hypothetical protein KKA85_13175 [bacterium]|nr:hypothetical protein [bacterium]
MALLDSDDMMLPGKLSAQAAVFASLPEVNLVCTDFRRVDADGAVFAFLDRPCHDYRVNGEGISAGGWRRFPSVIRARESQLDHITDPEMRRYLDERLLYMRLGYSWGLRGDGRYGEALPAYREAIAHRWPGGASAAWS